jgi:hypothetical protein
MSKKTITAIISGISLTLAATCLPAFAFGGHHRGGMQYAMLARAAGVTKDQVHTAFKNDAALKTDFQNLRATKKAMDACIVAAGVAAGGCSAQITAYANAQSALTQEKMTVWQGLFAGAPNASAAVTLKGQLDALNTQKHSLMHSVFSSAKSTNAVTAPSPQVQQ